MSSALYFALIPTASLSSAASSLPDGSLGEGQSGIVYEEGFSFPIAAPTGWILDNSSGRAQGSDAVFYPEGSSWTRSTAVL